MADLRSLFNRARGFARELNGRGLVTYAASCAFDSFLALFPMAALAASLVPCIGVSEAALLRFLGTVAPVGVAALLQAILSNVYENVFPALPLSLLALLWSAAQAFSELLKGMTAMTDPARQAGFLKRRLRAILLTMALMMMMMRESAARKTRMPARSTSIAAKSMPPDRNMVPALAAAFRAMEVK